MVACGVCRTGLHVVDGALPNPMTPITPGHEIIGRIVLLSAGVEDLQVGQRVGIPWLGHTCGVCPYCMDQRENLCDRPLFTGYTRDGGFVTSVIADARFAFPLGEERSDVSPAQLLCAGLIGWRSLRLAGEGQTLGAYGFGAAGHIAAQVAKWRGRRVYPFPRPGDLETRAFARGLCVAWAGGSDEAPPESIDAAVIYATVGDLAPLALKAARKGGIQMSEIPSFPEDLLWQERQLVSVANLARQDGIDFLGLAPKIGGVAQTTSYPLNGANQTLADLSNGRFDGPAVLVP